MASSLLAARDNIADAIAEMEKAITLEPGRSDSYLTLGLLQQKNNQPDAAEASFKKAVELDPKSTQAQLILGSYYQSRGRWSDAEAQFRNAIASDPGNPGARGAWPGSTWKKARRKRPSTFCNGQADFPDNSVGYRLLGDFYFAVGDFDQATAEYSTLLQEHPKDLQVKKNYVQLLILKNRLEEARKLNDEILSAYPKDTDALVNRGQIQIQNGSLNDASSTLQAALQNDPENALAHYYLWDCAGEVRQLRARGDGVERSSAPPPQSGRRTKKPGRSGHAQGRHDGA